MLIAGQRSPLTAPLEAAFIRDDIAVRRLASLDRMNGEVTNVPRAVLQITPPAGRGAEIRAFRRLAFTQLQQLAAVMPQRASILVVVDGRHLATEPRMPAHRIEGTMLRLRAAAAQERGSAVTVNAIFLSGAVDCGTVAKRVWEAMRGGSLPDSGYLIDDEDIRDRSIAAAISEQCS